MTASALAQVANALALLVQEHSAPNRFETHEVLLRCTGLTAARIQAASRGVAIYARPEPGKVAIFTYGGGGWTCGALEDDGALPPEATHAPRPVDNTPRGLAVRIREAAGKVNGRRVVLPGITADDIYLLADAFLGYDPEPS
jgi:hypothetical protein